MQRARAQHRRSCWRWPVQLPSWRLQLSEARERASRLEQETRAALEKAAQWRDREADASAQVQLLYALILVPALAVQPSL